MTLDADCKRAWSLHFHELAKGYRADARLALSLARRAQGKERTRWTGEARKLWRVARKCDDHAAVRS